MSGVMNDVIVIREGFCKDLENGLFKANGTITLIKGTKTVLVDCGLPMDKDFLIEKLAENQVDPNGIHFVIGTHGHSDHIGNLNLFPSSTIIVSYDICNGDIFEDNKLKEGEPYPLTNTIEIWPTPGHTGSDISVIVRNSAKGVIVIAGDLFECYEDLKNDTIWRSVSENPDMQQKSRELVLKMADYIIPGHGPGFAVEPALKDSIGNLST